MQSAPDARPDAKLDARIAAAHGIPRSGSERATQVRTIFSEIAPRYDLLNHVLSLNVDRSWRRAAVAKLDWERAPGGIYLDACAGTFDLSLELARRSDFTGRVVATDFAGPMLVEGLPKIAGQAVSPACADSLALPFADGAFDGATVAFGVRNLSDVRAGLAELRRVTRTPGRVVVLEFTTPPNRLVRGAYHFYFRRILPTIGRIVSGHPWAYTYLPESVGAFPGPRELASLFESVGFRDVGWSFLTGGIAALHWGVVA